jgi:hypothetical protein
VHATTFSQYVTGARPVGEDAAARLAPALQVPAVAMEAIARADRYRRAGRS